MLLKQQINNHHHQNIKNYPYLKSNNSLKYMCLVKNNNKNNIKTLTSHKLIIFLTH